MRENLGYMVYLGYLENNNHISKMQNPNLPFYSVDNNLGYFEHSWDLVLVMMMMGFVFHIHFLHFFHIQKFESKLKSFRFLARLIFSSESGEVVRLGKGGINTTRLEQVWSIASEEFQKGSDPYSYYKLWL